MTRFSLALLTCTALLAAPAMAQAASASSSTCDYTHAQPRLVMAQGAAKTVTVNTCGQRYETGYRLEGNTLYFPGGGTHQITKASDEQARALLVQAYGLVKSNGELIRTRW